MRARLRELGAVFKAAPVLTRIVLVYSLVPVIWYVVSVLVQREWAYAVLVPLFLLELVGVLYVCAYTLRTMEHRRQVLRVLANPSLFQRAPEKVQDEVLAIVTEFWSQESRDNWRRRMTEPGS